VRRQGKISELISLSDRNLSAEAYTRNSVLRLIQLRFKEQSTFTDEFCLVQNWPNPAIQETNLSWFLPKGTQASLKVMDNTGKVIWQQTGTFKAGWNQYRLSTANFPPGVLYYQFKSKDYQATRKMVVIHP
jgi:hypothetical protein